MIDRETPTARLGAERNLIVAVVGPTASGKSDLALDLAQLLPQERQGVIVRASPWREMRYHHPDRNESTFDSRLIRT